MIACPDFEGCECYLQQIKMPMFMTNRTLPNLYYLKENRNGSVEFISSSRGTEEVVRQQAGEIGKNVVGDNVVNYVRLTPVKGGCEWVSVLCIDIAGDIPNALKR